MTNKKVQRALEAARQAQESIKQAQASADPQQLQQAQQQLQNAQIEYQEAIDDVGAGATAQQQIPLLHALEQLQEAQQSMYKTENQLQ